MRLFSQYLSCCLDNYEQKFIKKMILLLCRFMEEYEVAWKILPTGCIQPKFVAWNRFVTCPVLSDWKALFLTICVFLYIYIFFLFFFLLLQNTGSQLCFRLLSFNLQMTQSSSFPKVVLRVLLPSFLCRRLTSQESTLQWQGRMYEKKSINQMQKQWNKARESKQTKNNNVFLARNWRTRKNHCNILFRSQTRPTQLA